MQSAPLGNSNCNLNGTNKLEDIYGSLIFLNLFSMAETFRHPALLPSTSICRNESTHISPVEFNNVAVSCLNPAK